MRIRVEGIAQIGDLADDCKLISRTVKHRGSVVVRRNTEQGKMAAAKIASRAAGPHGANYANRLEAEMVSPLVGEYGPSPLLGARYVGVSGSAGAMRDLEKSADKQGPKFARDVSRMVDGLFWP